MRALFVDVCVTFCSRFIDVHDLMSSIGWVSLDFNWLDMRKTNDSNYNKRYRKERKKKSSEKIKTHAKNKCPKQNEHNSRVFFPWIDSSVKFDVSRRMTRNKIASTEQRAKKKKTNEKMNKFVSICQKFRHQIKYMFEMTNYSNRLNLSWRWDDIPSAKNKQNKKHQKKKKKQTKNSESSNRRDKIHTQNKMRHGHGEVMDTKHDVTKTKQNWFQRDRLNDKLFARSFCRCRTTLFAIWNVVSMRSTEITHITK